MRAVIDILRDIAVAGLFLCQATPVIKCLLTAQAVSAGGGDALALVVVTEPD
ncbi:hypothetical protein D3C81_1972800 [compost metagenome]